MIFGKLCGEPWYGENTGLLQGFATGPGDVELARGALLPVPGAMATEVRSRGLVHLCEEPQCPRGSHDEAKRIGPDDTLELPALVLTQAIKGVAVPNRDFHGPALAILLQEVLCTEGQLRGEEGFEWGTWLVRAPLVGARGGRTPGDHHMEQPPRQDGVPETDPAVDLGLCLRRMPEPAPALTGQRFGGAQQRAFLSRASAAFAHRRFGQAIELAGDQEPRDHLDGSWQVAQEFFGRIAAIRQHPNRPLGDLGGDKLQHGAGQRTAGTVGLMVPAGLLLFQIELQANGDGHAVAGPPRERNAHDAQHKVQPPQGAIFLAGRARPVAIAGPALDVPAGFFLRAVVKLEHDRGIRRDQLSGMANDAGPHAPARVVEGAPQEDIEPGEMLEGGRPRQPQIGGDRVLLGSQRPAAGQEREGPPGGNGKESLEQSHHKGPERRRQKSVHGNVLQYESLKGRGLSYWSQDCRGTPYRGAFNHPHRVQKWRN